MNKKMGNLLSGLRSISSLANVFTFWDQSLLPGQTLVCPRCFTGMFGPIRLVEHLLWREVWEGSKLRGPAPPSRSPEPVPSIVCCAALLLANRPLKRTVRRSIASDKGMPESAQATCGGLVCIAPSFKEVHARGPHTSRFVAGDLSPLKCAQGAREMVAASSLAATWLISNGQG
jgi:hypothetical protein